MSTPASPADPPPLRATDAQRAAIAEALDTAFAQGQLDRAEHYERIQIATHATYVDDLRGLLFDLQGVDVDLPPRPGSRRRRDTRPAAGPATPSSARRSTSLTPEQIRAIEVPKAGSVRGLAVAGIVGAVALVGALMVFGVGDPFGETETPADPAGIEQVDDVGGADGLPDAGRDYGSPADASQAPPLSPEGLAHLIATAPDASGSEVAASLVVHPEHASLTVIDAEHPTRSQMWTYRGGWDEFTDRPTTDEASFRIADVDPAVVSALVADAPGRLGVGGTPSTFVSVSADSAGMPEFSVHSRDEFHASGHLTADHTGTIRSVYPAR